MGVCGDEGKSIGRKEGGQFAPPVKWKQEIGSMVILKYSVYTEELTVLTVYAGFLFESNYDKKI